MASTNSVFRESIAATTTLKFGRIAGFYMDNGNECVLTCPRVGEVH